MVSHRKTSSPKIQTPPSSAVVWATSRSQAGPLPLPGAVWSPRQLLQQLLAAESTSEVKQPLQHLQSRDPNSESHVSHSSRELSGHTTKGKAPQHLETTRAQNTGGCCESSRAGPRSPDAHRTGKTRIEVITRGPRRKRSVNEDRAQRKRGRKRKALRVRLLQGGSRSPPADQNPLAVNRQPSLRTTRSSLSAGPAPPTSLPSSRSPWPSPRPSRPSWPPGRRRRRRRSAGGSGRSPPRPPPAS